MSRLHKWVTNRMVRVATVATLLIGSAWLLAVVPGAPVLDPIGPQSGDELTSITFTATASDPDLDSFSFSLSGEPAGATINPVTGDFEWTPTEGQDGVFMFDVVVTDVNLEFDSETITVTVAEFNLPPVLDPIGPQGGDELTLISFTATASDTDTVNPGAVPNVLTFSLSGAPAGATINPTTGLFDWTPTEGQDGVFMFDVVVTDDGADLLSDSETITVTVAEVNTPPVLDPIGPQGGDELTLISFTATASDTDTVNPGAVPNVLTFSLSGAPAGATINPTTGLFDWTPTEGQDGVFMFDVVVTDDGAGLLFDTETITVTVAEVNTPPVLGLIGDDTVFEVNFQGSVPTTSNFFASASDTDTVNPGAVPNTLTYSLDATSLGKGMTINPSTGEFSWSPTELQDGVHSVTITVTDDGVPPLDDSQTFSITVTEVNEPPVVSYTLMPTTLAWGQAAWAAVTVVDIDFVLGVPNTITLSLPVANPDADLEQTSNTEGFLVIAPKQSDGTGVRSITVRATDDGVPSYFDDEVAGYTVIATVHGANWGGHAGTITGIDLHEFSTFGLATVARDSLGKVWTPFSTEHLMHKTLLGHNGPLTGTAHFGGTIATASEDGAIHYYDTATGALTGTAPGHAGGVNALSRNAPATSMFATGGNDWSVKTWFPGSGAPVHVYLGHTDKVTAVAMSLDRVFSGSRDKKVKIWESGVLLATISDHTGEILAVASTVGGVEPIDYYHASSSRDRTCKLYMNGVQVGSVATGGKLVTSLAYEQGLGLDRLAVGYEDGTVQIVDRTTGAVIDTFTEAVGTISAMSWNGPFLYTADSRRDLRRYFETPALVFDSLVSAHGDWVTGATTQESMPSLFMSGSWDGRAKLRDSIGHLTLVTLDHGSPLVGAHALGVEMATVGRNNEIKFWAGFPFLEIASVSSATPIWSTGQFAGAVLAGGQDGSVNAYVSGSAGPVDTWPHGAPVTAVAGVRATAPVGFRIASGGSDGTVKVWDTTPVPTHSFSGLIGPAVGLSFSGNGRRLAVAAGATYVYNLETSTLLMSKMEATGMNKVALSPNGETVAAIAHPGYLRVYRVFDGAQVYQHFEQTGPLLTDVAWTIDGASLIATRQDGTLFEVFMGPFLVPAPVSSFSAPVVFRDFNGVKPESVEVQVYEQETGRHFLTQQIPLGNEDRVQVEIAGRKKFSAYIKHGTFLTRRLDLDLTKIGESTRVFDLWNGDTNGDDSINLGDFLIVRRAFGATSGQPAYDARADLNKDGRVDVKDFVILRKRFGARGDL